MKNKHTPGPWKADAAGAIFGPDGKCIQTCGAYAVRFGEGTEEAYANARLIAAAPDLLETLKRISKGEGAFNYDPLEHAKNCIDDMKYIAFVAIAKAEGKE